MQIQSLTSPYFQPQTAGATLALSARIEETDMFKYQLNPHVYPIGKVHERFLPIFDLTLFILDFLCGFFLGETSGTASAETLPLTKLCWIAAILSDSLSPLLPSARTNVAHQQQVGQLLSQT